MNYLQNAHPYPGFFIQSVNVQFITSGLHILLKRCVYLLLEPISKIRLGFRARRETVKKRSIHVVCEHFEPLRNAAMGT